MAKACSTCHEAYSWDTTKPDNHLPVQSRCCAHMICQGCFTFMTSNDFGDDDDDDDDDMGMEEVSFGDDIDSFGEDDNPTVIACPICQTLGAFDGANPIVSFTVCALLKELTDHQQDRSIGTAPSRPQASFFSRASATIAPNQKSIQACGTSGCGVTDPAIMTVPPSQSSLLSSKNMKPVSSRVRAAENQDEFVNRKKQRMADASWQQTLVSVDVSALPSTTPVSRSNTLPTNGSSTPSSTSVSRHLRRSPFHDPTTAYAAQQVRSGGSSLAGTLSSLSLHS